MGSTSRNSPSIPLRDRRSLRERLNAARFHQERKGKARGQAEVFSVYRPRLGKLISRSRGVPAGGLETESRRILARSASLLFSRTRRKRRSEGEATGPGRTVAGPAERIGFQLQRSFFLRFAGTRARKTTAATNWRCAGAGAPASGVRQKRVPASEHQARGCARPARKRRRNENGREQRGDDHVKRLLPVLMAAIPMTTLMRI